MEGTKTVCRSYFSAFEITADLAEPPSWWNVYGYGRAYQDVDVLPYSREPAPVHTNLLSVPESGMPKACGFTVVQLRAVASEPLRMVVRRFFASCAVQFEVQDRVIEKAPLIELLLAPRHLMPPVELPERVKFAMYLTCDNKRAFRDLQGYLREGAQVLTTWVYIEGVGVRAVV